MTFDKATVKDAPRVDVGRGRLSQLEETDVTRYYRVES